MQIHFNNKQIKNNLLKGQFGLEKENIRINQKGALSKIKHPFNNPQIDRDFSESQIEFITNKHNSIQSMLNELIDLQKQSAEKLLNLKSGEEYLWPFSNPPQIKNDEHIIIADYHGDLAEKTVYRQYLAKKYGKKKMLYSGIHFNFSFPEELLKQLYKTENDKNEKYMTFKNNIYLDLSKKVTYYTWLIVYLTAASPIYDESLFNTKINKEYASFRCSKYGYWNFFNPILDYSSFEEYLNSIKNYINKGLICSEAELYYPVRLKCPVRTNLYKLKNCEINHIELRMIDLNPLFEEGIGFNDVKFLHFFLIYLFSLPPVNFGESQQVAALENEKIASELCEENIFLDLDGERVNIVNAGLDFLSGMEDFYKNLGFMDVLEIISFQKEKFLNHKGRYAYQVKDLFGDDFMGKGVVLAREHALFSANNF